MTCFFCNRFQLFQFVLTVVIQVFSHHMRDEVAEWLRRWTANPMCSARMGSNPILVVLFSLRLQKKIIDTKYSKSSLIFPFINVFCLFSARFNVSEPRAKSHHSLCMLV